MLRRTPASIFVKRKTHAKHVIQSNIQGETLQEIDKAAAYETSHLYRTALENYTHESTSRTQAQTKLTSAKQGKRRTTTFTKVAKKADSLDMDYETYINGQFYWFHQWFHRYPKPSELIGMKGRYNCEWRARQYKVLKATQKPIPVIQSPVIPSEEIPSQKIDSINKQKLHQLCKQWQKTENQILHIFSSEGVFDVEWLRQNYPRYC